MECGYPGTGVPLSGAEPEPNARSPQTRRARNATAEIGPGGRHDVTCVARNGFHKKSRTLVSHEGARNADILRRVYQQTRTVAVLGLFGQAVLERVELVLDAGRQLLADELEPLLDQRELGPPLVGVDSQCLINISRRDVQSSQVQVSGRRHNADRGALAVGLVLDPLDRPLQHAAVLTEARPQEAAVLAA